MSAEQKAGAKIEKTVGAVKKAMGKTVGDDTLTAKGEAEKAKGDARAAEEKSKDFLGPQQVLPGRGDGSKGRGRGLVPPPVAAPGFT
ncbi:CsbD family protein [Streptantibioticus rubrisoli]|uniref:CsbD family protein n=1 Tax=Streptantibioticus rubrisoli TaxID=1387313 RepID=UPI003557E0DA